jgi:ABC-type lipoprotein export system ATPase subunit
MLLQLDKVRKTFGHGARRLDVLQGIDLTVEAGQFVAISGPSGCGKTTLLQLIGGLDRPTSGTLTLEGSQLGERDDASLARLRRRRLGFVFQLHHLLPALNALENVSLPLLLDGVKTAEAETRARAELELVGLAARLTHLPSELSGGEAQRVALARALVARPALVLADEPTGNLDSQAGALVLELLSSAVRERGQTVLMATHDASALQHAQRCLRLRDGRLAANEAS